MAFELKPYDVSEKCEKCGSHGHALVYSSGYEFFGHDIPEHIRLKCGVCGYEVFCKPKL